MCNIQMSNCSIENIVGDNQNADFNNRPNSNGPKLDQLKQIIPKIATSFDQFIVIQKNDNSHKTFNYYNIYNVNR